MSEISNEKENLIIDLYINKGYGQDKTARKAQISKREVKECLKRNGYKLRNRYEAIVASNQGRNLLNDHDYFNRENSNMAWLLGFLAADGSIEKDRNVIKLSLSSIDKEILEKIRKEISLDSIVKDYVTSKGFEMSKLQWSSAQHKKDLARYSIVPAKTFILKPPYALDRKYWIDYIRGYWDGDGSITIYKKNYNSLAWQITSATKEVLEFIVDFFYEEYGIPKVKVHSFERGLNTLYILQYSTSASKEIYNHLYTPDSLCLERKKKHFDEAIKIKEKIN